MTQPSTICFKNWFSFPDIAQVVFYCFECILGSWPQLCVSSNPPRELFWRRMCMWRSNCLVWMKLLKLVSNGGTRDRVYFLHSGSQFPWFNFSEGILEMIYNWDMANLSAFLVDFLAWPKYKHLSPPLVSTMNDNFENNFAP